MVFSCLRSPDLAYLIPCFETPLYPTLTDLALS